MNIFRRKVPALEIGDRYIKAEDRHAKVWQIAKIWTTVDGVRHVRLINAAVQSDTVMVSARVLMDHQHFLPAPQVANLSLGAQTFQPEALGVDPNI